jgi:UDP-2,4-diacetamido-2,4,6-trideoxy-beta-L-altropyranose hydrolase
VTPREANRTPGRLTVRADAGREIGVGHLMRCLAVAEEWQARGGEVCVLAALDGAIPVRLRESDVPWEPWPFDSKDPRDVAATVRRASDFGNVATAGWLLLDGYRFGQAYYGAAGAAGLRVMAIEDGPRLPCHAVDIIIDGSPDAPDQYPAPAKTVLLRGSQYVLLRREFTGRRGALTRGGLPVKEEAEVPRVLVTFGGSDPQGLTLEVLTALRQDRPVGQWAIVIGSHYPDPRMVRQLAALDPSVKIVDEPSDMSTWIDWADVVLAAAGSTAWEIAARRTPAALVVAAENQARVAATLAAAGAALDLGVAARLSAARMIEAVLDLARATRKRCAMAEAAASLVDGKGASRVIAVAQALGARRLDKEDVLVREATDTDARPSWALANDPEVRARSFDRPEISWQSHETWFRGKLRTESSSLWILDVAGAVAGVVRYDRDDDGSSAEVHFAIAAPFRGKGLGTGALRWTFARACRDLGVERVRGVVLKSNLASSQAFLSNGYLQANERVERGHDCIVYERRYGGEGEHR